MLCVVRQSVVRWFYMVCGTQFSGMLCGTNAGKGGHSTCLITTPISLNVLSQLKKQTCIHYRTISKSAGDYNNTKHSTVSVIQTDTVKTSEQNDFNMTEFLSDILQTASQKDKMVTTVSFAKTKVNVQAMVDAGLKPRRIRELVGEKPSLLLLTDLHTIVEFLANYGFAPAQIIKLLSSADFIKRIGVTGMTTMMESLRTLGFGDTELLTMLSSFPEILICTPKEISTRVQNLRDLFKSRDALVLIAKCPNILFDDWEVITEKFNYVYHVMGITQKQMVHSSLFIHDIGHIQVRHQFVSRAGIFKPVNKKAGEKSTNPRLEDIVDRSEKAFVRLVPGTTIKDYTVFSELFEREIREGRFKFDFDSSDIDSDDV